MRRNAFFFFAFLLIASLAHAATPFQGKLQELAVFPQFNITFGISLKSVSGEYVILDDTDPQLMIDQLREKLKLQPENSESLLELGHWFNDLGETNSARMCYEKVEQLTREKIRTRPQDGLLLVDLARALTGIGKSDEAVHACRSAVLISTNEWRCWAQLGYVLSLKSFEELFPASLRSKFTLGSTTIPQEVLDYRPPLNALKTSEELLAEASKYFDRATSIASNNPNVFLQRAGFEVTAAFVRCFINHIRNNDHLNVNQLLDAFFCEKSSQNLEQVVKLNPKAYQAIALIPFFEFTRDLTRSYSTNNASSVLQDSMQRSSPNAVSRLKLLENDPDKNVVVGSLEKLALINLLLYARDSDGPKRAKAYIDRALAIDSSRQTTWNLWLGTLVQSGSPEEIVAGCEKMVKSEDSARNRLFLSKAWSKQEKWDKAIEQAELAIKHETNNISAHLMLAALALHDDSNPYLLGLAAQELMTVGDLLRKSPSNNDTKLHWREFFLNSAIVSGLFNQNDRALEFVNEILRYFPEDEDAQKILRALKAASP